MLKAADTFLFTSKQEGLARSLMEAMASKIPCVVSRIRGNTELVCNGVSGFLCTNEDEYIKALEKLIESSDLREQFVEKSYENLKNFSIEKVEECLFDIYSKEFK